MYAKKSPVRPLAEEAILAMYTHPLQGVQSAMLGFAEMRDDLTIQVKYTWLAKIL